MWLPWTRNKASCTQSYQILQSQRAKQSAFSLRSTSRQKLSICNFTTFQKARSNIGLLAKLFSGFLHSTSPNKSSENDFLLPVETDVVTTWYIFCNPLSAHFFLTFYLTFYSSEPIKCFPEGERLTRYRVDFLFLAGCGRGTERLLRVNFELDSGEEVWVWWWRGVKEESSDECFITSTCMLDGCFLLRKDPFFGAL